MKIPCKMVFNISHATWPQRVGLLFCFFGLSRVNHVNDTPNHLFARFWNPINTVYSLYLELARVEFSLSFSSMSFKIHAFVTKHDGKLYSAVILTMKIFVIFFKRATLPSVIPTAH